MWVAWSKQVSSRDSIFRNNSIAINRRYWVDIWPGLFSSIALIFGHALIRISLQLLRKRVTVQGIFTYNLDKSFSYIWILGDFLSIATNDETWQFYVANRVNKEATSWLYNVLCWSKQILLVYFRHFSSHSAWVEFVCDVFSHRC